MCLTIPGKIIEIGEDRYVIEYSGENRVVNISIVKDLKVGDYVIVTHKIIIAKLTKEDAEKALKLLK